VPLLSSGPEAQRLYNLACSDFLRRALCRGSASTFLFAIILIYGGVRETVSGPRLLELKSEGVGHSDPLQVIVQSSGVGHVVDSEDN